MSLQRSFDHATSAATRFTATYLEARPRHAALAPYSSPAEVSAALGRGSPLALAERDALVVALVTEHQVGRHPLWQSLLLGAFAPMLTRLRMRIGHRRDEDLDQRVLVAFLAAIGDVRVGAYVLLAIRWATEGELFYDERAARRGVPTCMFDEETHPCDVFDLDADARATAAEIARLIESQGGDELLAAILTDRGAGESLKDYVARTYAGCTEEARAATYYRLRTARARIVAELRQRLAPGVRAA